VNNSSANSKDILDLITVIQQKVLQKKGIFLEPEVRMIGFDYP
jgi:UDP-N-acetylmuramate dehydrogenase